MAEAYETPEVDDDVMPDGEEPTEGIPIFQNLDAGNLVEQIADPDVDYRCADTMDLLSEAESTMEAWKKKYEKAIALATLTPEAEQKNFPFPKASNVVLPFLVEAMLDFHSRTVPELVWAKQVVNMKTWGRSTPQKDEQSQRTQDYMNYQLTEQMVDWRSDQDKLLLQLPAVGTAYKKTYYDGDKGEVCSELYRADEVIFCHDYATFDEAPDKFIRKKYTRNEVIGFIRGDAAWDIEEENLPSKEEQRVDLEFVYAFTWIDLDKDGLDEPYEVVIWEEKEKVVAIYPAYDEDGIVVNDKGDVVRVTMADLFTQYRFLPDPEGGPMGMGWGILLWDMFEALNTSVRQMMDAGTLSNLAGNSGLIDSQMSPAGRGNRQQAGPIEMRLGEMTPVTTGGKPLGQSVVQFPYSGPNTALFQLVEWLLTNARDMTNSALNMDTNSQEAAAMYLARLQQGLKIPNSIVMRVYDCARHEFKKIAELNYKHYSDKKYNTVLDGEVEHSMRADFNPDTCDVRPAIDPSQGSDIERMQRANLILQEMKEDQRGILNPREVYLDWLETLRVEDLERLAPEPSGEPTPMEKMMLANQQRMANLEERDMKLKEREAQQKEARLQMEAADNLRKAMREGAEIEMSADEAEARIAKLYAEAFAKLWEIGMAGDDPVATVQNMESRLIEGRSAPEPPTPMQPPDPNQQPQGSTETAV